MADAPVRKTDRRRANILSDFWLKKYGDVAKPKSHARQTRIQLKINS